MQKGVRKVPQVLREIIERQPDVRFDRVHLKKVGQDALEFELVFFVLDAAYGKFMDTQQAILLEAMEACEEMGVSGGGPAQHLVIERGDRASGQSESNAVFRPTGATLQRAR